MVSRTSAWALGRRALASKPATAKLEIYRWKGEGEPYVQKYDLALDSCGPMMLDALIAIKNKQGSLARALTPSAPLSHARIAECFVRGERRASEALRSAFFLCGFARRALTWPALPPPHRPDADVPPELPRGYLRQLCDEHWRRELPGLPQAH